MKSMLIYLFLLTITGNTCAQNREILKQNKFNSVNFKPYEVEIKKKWFDSVKLYFPGDIEFVDERADKSKLGFVRMGEGNTFYNFVFPKHDISYINSKLPTKSTSSVGGERIVIVINHFWMSQIIVKSIKADGVFRDDKAYVSFCNFNADYYLQKDKNMKYLGKLDTVVSIRKWIGKISEDLLKETLIISLSVCDKLISCALTNPYFAAELLADSLKNKYAYPILKTSLPKKGIYPNYEDFLNNKPAEGDFDLKEDKKRTSLQSNSIDTSVTNAAWGYSDGKDIYKHLNENYYKMNRVENTFELAGPRDIRKLYTLKEIFFRIGIETFLFQFAAVGGSLMTIFSNEKIMRELVPYQLNIKEGTFY